MKRIMTLSLSLLVALSCCAQKPNKKLVKLAQKGDTAAAMQVARCYLDAPSATEQSLVDGYKFLEMVAGAGNADAMLELSNLSEKYPFLVQGDYLVPVLWLQKAGEAGKTSAYIKLGDWCMGGHPGLPQGEDEARKYYEKAAKAGDGEGWYRVAKLIGNLEAPGSKIPERYTPLKKAADMGHTKAAKEAGILLFQYKDFDESFLAPKYLRMAAEAGDAEAMNYLGRCYSAGLGVEKDNAQKVAWYKKASDAGNATATFNVGYCYENGEGVQKDYAEAAKWYAKAAEQGDDKSILAEATLYYKADSPIRDYTKAVSLLAKAKEKNVTGADGMLGMCLLNGWGIEKNEKRGILLIEKGTNAYTEQGVECCKAMARCYREGIVFDKDEERAKNYDRRAAEIEAFLKN